MTEAVLSEFHSEEIKSICRTAVGDELRSITYFTPDSLEQIYLRSDLEQTADLVGFAELERMGFRSQEAYANSELGPYRATVRMFDNGYLTRIIEGRHGVWVTTDSMSMDRFDELEASLRTSLQSIDAP